MALAQSAGRRRYRLILLVLTAVTLLSLDFRDVGPLDRAQSGVRDLLEPVVGVASTLTSPVRDAWGAVWHYDDLKAENEALRAELDALRGEQLRAEADVEAYRRLLEATDLPYSGDLPTVAAAVVRGPVGNFDDHVVTIDKGRDDGIEVGQAVVTGAGLVGRVARVDAATALVQLLSDPDLPVGVRLVATDEIGLGHGVGGDPTRFVVDQGIPWPAEDDPSAFPAAGSAVVTAPDSRYPADIPVGVVRSVEPGEGGLTQVVTVELAADVTDLAFVSVVTVEPVDEPPRPDLLVPVTPGATDGATDGVADGDGTGTGP